MSKAKIEGLPTYPKTTDYVDICRKNRWSLNDLARKLGYEHFGQAQRKMTKLRTLGQCIQCRQVSHFPKDAAYLCSSECEKNRHNARNNQRYALVRMKKEECKTEVNREKVTGYAKRVRSHPLFVAEAMRAGRTKPLV